MTLYCACGSDDWIAANPGTIEITTGADPNVLLLKPVPAVPAQVWCVSCWPWVRNPAVDEMPARARRGVTRVGPTDHENGRRPSGKTRDTAQTKGISRETGCGRRKAGTLAAATGIG